MFKRAWECRSTIDVLNDDQIREAGKAWAARTLGEDEKTRLEGIDDRAHAKMQETYDIVLPALKADLARGRAAAVASRYRAASAGACAIKGELRRGAVTPGLSAFEG